MSRIKGDIRDITTPSVGCYAAVPFNRYAIEEFNHEHNRCGSDPSRGRLRWRLAYGIARGHLYRHGEDLRERAKPNRDGASLTSSAPLYRLNYFNGSAGGTGESSSC